MFRRICNGHLNIFATDQNARNSSIKARLTFCPPSQLYFGHQHKIIHSPMEICCGFSGATQCDVDEQHNKIES